MLATVFSRAQFGMQAPPVTIDVHVTSGLPNLSVVGLAEAAVREAKDRVRSAVTTSGFQWPPGRVIVNLLPAVDPAAADAARAQYIGNHPEPALVALVLHECNAWLLDLARRRAEKESDKFVLMASINLVNCTAHAPTQHRRAS